MTGFGLAQIAVFLALVVAPIRPAGDYIASVMQGGRRWLRPVERLLYRLGGIDETAEHTWVSYAVGLLLFHLLGIAALYGLQRAQTWLPLNPQHFDPVAPDLALNTAVSFEA
jgi:K+-transporting ATPase ATPase A chain